jgi:hypothetical protein
MTGMAAQDRWRPVPLARRHGIVLCGRGVIVRLPSEGSAVLFRGCDASAVLEWAAQCHGTVAGHAAQRRTVAGIAPTGELAEQCRGMIPKRVMVWIRF